MASEAAIEAVAKAIVDAGGYGGDLLHWRDTAKDAIAAFEQTDEQKQLQRLAAAFDLQIDHGVPSAFIQYKGTDICMDFRCKCGASCHFDGDFAYTVKCPHCSQCYEMPPILFPRECAAQEDAKIMDRDEWLDEDATLADPT